ncbi:MAG TPA: PLDc N-terminal domain-containing protein [Cyclobacteriaceae bacterium]|nr:PLDc N-terminal domain-containing protein [Cyclobacteriaceae bacterium]
MARIISILIIIVVAWTIYSIWENKNLPSNKKVVWTIVCILFPLLGSLLYYLLAEK